MKRILLLFGLYSEPKCPHSTITTIPVTSEVAKAALVLPVRLYSTRHMRPLTLQNADRSPATSSR
jgi:hypothetical protein